MASELSFLVCFVLLIAFLLLLDLGIFNKHDHVVEPKEAAFWSTIWVLLAGGFYLFLQQYGHLIHHIETVEDLANIQQRYHQPFAIIPENFTQSIANYKHTLSLEFATGYLVEESLSVDNLFVILLIFTSFNVHKALFHRVLFWGIIGAVVFRCIFIFTGSYLVNQFNWILYLFAAFLLFTGIKMLFSKDEDETIDTENHTIVKLTSRLFAVHPRFEGNKFFIKTAGRTFITPLFLVLLMIEFTDVLFAVDSIPAIFSITRDPYIIFFSNIFAVMGLRSMFFLLANVMDKFHYFKTGLAVLLSFIGAKMFLHHWLEAQGFSNTHALLVIVGILSTSVVASLLFPKVENH